MSIAKTALFSLLIACWFVGLINQFHSLDSTLFYLLLSAMMVAAVEPPTHTWRRRRSEAQTIARAATSGW